MKLVNLIVFSIFAVVFFSWVSPLPSVGQDWHYIFPETTREFSVVPSVYRSFVSLGQNTFGFAGVEAYYQFTGRIFGAILPWVLIEKLFWFLPLLGITIFSSYRLTKSLIGSLIYTTNTYVLMIIGGGQLGVALAYGIAPLVLQLFFDIFPYVTKRLSRKLFERAILAGMAFALQVLIDMRIAYLTAGIIVFWYLWELFHLGMQKQFPFRSISVVFLSVLLTTVVLNLFWILPLLQVGISGVAAVQHMYGSVVGAKFFSFADFSNTIAFLHPNWPENLFGKVYFMRSEFLLIPMLAFSSILFLGRNRVDVGGKDGAEGKMTNSTLVFFVLVGLIGAFLAKGFNPLFENVYQLFFTSVPGFSMFRDPTKFYLLIAISYSVLIPFVLKMLDKRITKIGHLHLVSLLFLMYWFTLLNPVWTGKVGGLFHPVPVPSEYIQLTSNLANQKTFFRTFWIPQRDVYGFFSNTHPAIDSASELRIGSPSGVLVWLENKKNQKTLERWGVKYIILPSDTQGTLFVEDRKYSQEQKDMTQKQLDSFPWLTKKQSFSGGKIIVYQTPKYNNRFWIEDLAGNTKESFISSKQETGSSFIVDVGELDSPALLIFSEKYDPSWEFQSGDKIVKSKKTHDNLNSFFLSSQSAIKGTVYYAPQNISIVGLSLTGIGLVGIGLLYYLMRRK